MSRRRSIAVAVAAVIGVAGLPACAPDDGPEVGEVMTVDGGLMATPRYVAIAMPDGDLDLTVAIAPEVEVDGETVQAPAGAVLVTFEILQQSGEAMADLATEVALVAGSTTAVLDPDTITLGAAVLPGDGSDAQVVATFDGREVRWDVSTGDLAADSAPSYLADRAVATQSSASFTTEVELPEGLALATGQTRAVPVLQMQVQTAMWLPDRGWSRPDERWVVIALTVPDALAVTSPQSDDDLTVDVALESVTVVAGEKRIETERGAAGSAVEPDATSGTAVASVPDAVSEITVEVASSMTSTWADGDVPAVDVVAVLTSEPVLLG